MTDRMPPHAVAIGASAGGLAAVGTLLAALPPDFASAVLVVVHLQPRRPSLLAKLFGRRCALEVREVDDKEPLVGGVVYVAPPDYHLMVERERILALSCDPPVHFSRPSINVLFESVAASLGARSLGVLLTGASSDGAYGLQRIAEAGGLTAVEDPDTAFASTMPRAALALMQPDVVRDIAGIAAWLGAQAALWKRL